MEPREWLRAMVVVCCLFAISSGKETKIKNEDDSFVYNGTLARILVQYDAAVYESDLSELFSWTCAKCNGPTEGFEVTELIVDIQHCLQAYVGVAKDLNAIIITFRGTQEHSIQNWVEDLFWKQLDLNYPGMPDAMVGMNIKENLFRHILKSLPYLSLLQVHHGFYNAYHNTTLRHGVTHAVKRAKQIYGDLNIIVVGHSMGGAMAGFCALDLKVHHKAENIQVVTFGQPRIGNAAFVSYYSQLLPNTIRVTNNHDIVPHLPPYYSYFPRKTYHHFPTEVWLNNVGLGSLTDFDEKICDDSGEDASCSRSVMGNSIADHLVYFGVNLQADTWNSCKIVTDPRLAKYSTVDNAGNIVLRKPASSILKMKTQSDIIAVDE